MSVVSGGCVVSGDDVSGVSCVVNGGYVVHCDICGRWLCCTVKSVVNGGRVVHCDV